MEDNLSTAERARYHRQMILPGFGTDAQKKLQQARVLLVGCGGLGSPAALYLAAAGVGRIELIDPDQVAVHNLQRQVLFRTPQVGQPKVDEAAVTLRALNPEIEVVTHATELTPENARDRIAAVDVVLDGSDNFPTRYLVNDACVLEQRPLVSGSLFQYQGQVSVYAPHLGGPCLRCLFPQQPAPGEVPNCSEAGVIGSLCGTIGSTQATEAIKLITGIGDPLIGRLLVLDALSGQPRILQVKRDPDCPLCGETPSIFDIEPVHAPTTCMSTEASGSEAPLEIDVHQTQAALQGDPRPYLLDVREADEVAIAKIDGAAHIPLGELPARFESIPTDQPVIVYCHHGGRSLRATNFLRDRGLDQTTNMAGGIDAWAREIDPSLQRY